MRRIRTEAPCKSPTRPSWGAGLHHWILWRLGGEGRFTTGRPGEQRLRLRKERGPVWGPNPAEFVGSRRTPAESHRRSETSPDARGRVAPAYGSGGRGFESLPARTSNPPDSREFGGFGDSGHRTRVLQQAALVTRWSHPGKDRFARLVRTSLQPSGSVALRSKNRQRGLRRTPRSHLPSAHLESRGGAA